MNAFPAKSLAPVVGSVGLLVVASAGMLAGESTAEEVQTAAMEAAQSDKAVSDIQSDLDLKNAVQNELIWSDFIELTQVKVDADGGVVTLTGVVPTDAALRAATRCALRAGASSVRNFLRVGRE